MESFIIGYTQNGPALSSQCPVPFVIPSDHIRMIVNAAIDFDHQTGRRYREVRNVITDRMLPANRKSKFTKMPKRLPCGLFCGGRRFPEVSRAVSGLAHPLTLNPSPQRGEGLFNSIRAQYSVAALSATHRESGSSLEHVPCEQHVRGNKQESRKAGGQNKDARRMP